MYVPMTKQEKLEMLALVNTNIRYIADILAGKEDALGESIEEWEHELDWHMRQADQLKEEIEKGL